MFRAIFRPRTYLSEYYSEVDFSWDPKTTTNLSSVGQENSSLLAFYALVVVPAVRELVHNPKRMLEVGAGPTAYQLISLAPVLDILLVTDLLADNLRLLQNWEFPPNFWHPFIATSLFYETGQSPNITQITDRQALIRQKLRFARYDVISDSWQEACKPAVFDVVVANFCAESITSNRLTWQRAMDNLCAKVAPRGLLAMTALQNCCRYKVGNDYLPATPVTARDVRRILTAHRFEKVNCYTRGVSREEADYDGFVFVLARRGK